MKNKKVKKEVVKHLKSDIKTFKKEADDDRKLIKSLSKKKKKKDPKKLSKGRVKIEKVMHEFKVGDLHSGSKKGPLVKNPKQAIAIALSESRRLKKNKK